MATEQTTFAFDPAKSPPIHPGLHVARELHERHMTQRELALQMRRPARLVTEIVNGRKAVTADTALDLEKALEIEALQWLNMQSLYDLSVARLRRQQRTA